MSADAVSTAFARLADLPEQLLRIEAQLRRQEEQLAAIQRSLPPQLGTPADAARVIGVSMATVRRKIAAGEIPHTRVGRSVRVDLSALRPPDPDEVAPLAARARGR